MAQGCYNVSDHYLPASYKGISFIAADISSEHGRRGSEGEFPWGETTAYADLGIKIRKFSISGRFDDNNHIEQAAALIAACESPGAGNLVHPTRGIINASCTRLVIKDNPESKAGITEFDMDFTEVQEQGSVSAFSDVLSISSFISDVFDFFINGYEIDRVRWYNQPYITQTVENSFSQLKTAYSTVSLPLRDNNDYRILSDFDAIISDSYVIRTSEKAATALKNSFSTIDTKADAGPQKISAFRSLSDWSAQRSTLPAEGAEVENNYLISFQAISTAYYAKSIVETEPENFNQAIAQYEAVSGILESLRKQSFDDCNTPSFWLSLNNFKIEAQGVLLNRAYNAPALVEYMFPRSVHSLVAAYEIFGDAKRFQEIENRNTGYPWAVGQTIIAARS